MPTALFYSVKADAMLDEWVTTMRGNFQTAPVEKTGVYAGSNTVYVSGQTYHFRNTEGVTLFVGKELAVRNIGRPAAAVYAPTVGVNVKEIR